MPTNKQQNQLTFLRFLKRKAEAREFFTPEQVVEEVTDWKLTTATTYLRKQVKDYVDKTFLGYLARRSILRLDDEQFLKLVTQKEQGPPEYHRYLFDQVVSYELLLPLTNERTLRRELDALFFRDTLEKRLRQMDAAVLTAVIAKEPNESLDQYFARVATQLSELFSGYSIGIVNGRFLADVLSTQSEAAGREYLIDETTAVVRFIIPCKSSRMEVGKQWNHKHSSIPPSKHVVDEVTRIRTLFLEVFVEVITQSVDESVIWLLEDSFGLRRLYAWTKSPLR